MVRTDHQFNLYLLLRFCQVILVIQGFQVILVVQKVQRVL